MSGSRDILEQPTGPLTANKFPAFYINRMFITAFTRAPSPVPVPRRSIHFMPPHHNSILSSHLRLGCPSGPFPSVVHTKTLRERLYSIRATWPTYLIIFDWFTTIIFTEEYRPSSSSLCSFLHSPLTSSLLGPKFYSEPYSQTPSSYIHLWKWQTKFHTYTKQTVLFPYV